MSLHVNQLHLTLHGLILGGGVRPIMGGIVWAYIQCGLCLALDNVLFSFLGDYFGILLNKKATSFPFNIMNNPMYWGSTMNFLGYSLR